MIKAIWIGKAISENKRLIWNFKAKRMVNNPKYSEFISSVAWVIKIAFKEKKLKGNIEVVLNICLPGRFDSGNILKPCLDAIQQSGLIDNDNQIKTPKFGTRENTKRGHLDRIEFIISEVD